MAITAGQDIFLASDFISSSLQVQRMLEKQLN